MRWLLVESFVRGRVRRLGGHFWVLLVQWLWKAARWHFYVWGSGILFME